MKRDFDLIRAILVQVRNAPSGEVLQTLTCPAGIDEAVLVEHLQMTIEHGLIAGQVNSITPPLFIIERLTWAGHDFIEIAQNETIWKKVMAQAKAKGWAITIEVLEELLKAAAKTMAGL